MKRLFAAATMTVLFMAPPAAAQQYPPDVNSLTVVCSTPAPGETVGVEARTFGAGSQVTFTLSDDTVIGTGTADASGVVTSEVTIPADTAKAANTITASGQAPDGSPLSASTNITVGEGCQPVTPAAPAPGGELPRTGDDTSIPLARLGVALAAAGGVVLALAKRRRAAAHAAAA